MNIIGLYSKQSEYTGFPQYYDKAKGSYVTVDKKQYLDMSSFSVGCNLLGYADKRVNKAVKKAVNQGNNSSLIAKEEQELSKMLIEDNPGYDRVRYTRTGGEALMMALMLAENIKGSNVVTCGYHGWHIKNKNYISMNYNQILAIKPNIIIMEAIRNQYPTKEWISWIKEQQERGCLLIMDEVTSGYRFTYGGYYAKMSLQPDLIVYGKALSNGYPIAAVIGKSKIMDQDLFISSTYFTDRLSCAAAIETLKQLRKKDYMRLEKLGLIVRTAYKKAQLITGLDIKVNDTLPIVDVTFPDIKIKAEFTNQMLKRGILHNGLYYATFSHTPDQIYRLTSSIVESLVYVRNNLEKIQKQDYNLRERAVIVK